MTRVVHRPLPLSGALAVTVACLSVLSVATAAVQRTMLVVAVGSLAVATVGLEAIARRHVLVGGMLGIVGGGGILVGFAWTASRAPTLTMRLELLAGIAGVVVLGVGLTGAFRGRERTFVSVGTGLLLVGAFLSGILYGASAGGILTATAAAVIAWDLGEQAINLGEQVGREARTLRVELTHATGTVLVAAGAVALALAVRAVGVSGLSLAGLAALLGAGVLLTAALYN